MLTDGTAVDARPSDALTLAALTGRPICVATDVLDQADERHPELSDLIEEARRAEDDATTLAAEPRHASTRPGRPRKSTPDRLGLGSYQRSQLQRGAQPTGRG